MGRLPGRPAASVVTSQMVRRTGTTHQDLLFRRISTAGLKLRCSESWLSGVRETRIGALYLAQQCWCASESGDERNKTKKCALVTITHTSEPHHHVHERGRMANPRSARHQRHPQGLPPRRLGFATPTWPGCHSPAHPHSRCQQPRGSAGCVWHLEWVQQEVWAPQRGSRHHSQQPQEQRKKKVPHLMRLKGRQVWQELMAEAQHRRQRWS